MFDDSARQDSSWGMPARILLITLVFASGFLYFYFGPSLKELQGNTPDASALTTPIALSVGGQKFVIPENYTQFPRDRDGGVRKNVALYAKLPDYTGYTVADEAVFENNEPGSPIVHLQLESIRSPFSEAERIKRIYMPSVTDPEGERYLYGLQAFQFEDGTGYEGEDLYIGTDSRSRKAAITCARDADEILPPNCRRYTYLTDHVAITYRFKRSRLADWKAIDKGVLDLATSFMSEGTAVISESDLNG